VSVGSSGQNKASSGLVDLAWWLGLSGLVTVLVCFALIFVRAAASLLNTASYVSLVAVAVFLAGWVLGLVQAARRQAWGWFAASLLLFWPVLVFLFMQKRRRDPIDSSRTLRGVAAPVGQLPLPSPTPPGWYPDPVGQHEYRYWDGSQWTPHVLHRGEQSFDPPPAAPPK
jgi:hypothetical protein